MKSQAGYHFLTGKTVTICFESLPCLLYGIPNGCQNLNYLKTGLDDQIHRSGKPVNPPTDQFSISLLPDRSSPFSYWMRHT